MKIAILAIGALAIVTPVCWAQKQLTPRDGTIDNNPNISNYNNRIRSSFADTRGRDAIDSFAQRAGGSNGHERAGEGYVTFKNTRIEGQLVIDKDQVVLQKAIDDSHNFRCVVKLDDTSLKKIEVYNKGAKSLIIVRAQPADKRMVRLFHEGKLNIYDSRILCEFKPEMLANTHIITATNGNVRELNTSNADISKLQLTEQLNTVYGLKLDPATITWKQLTETIEKLD